MFRYKHWSTEEFIYNYKVDMVWRTFQGNVEDEATAYGEEEHK